MGQSLTTANSAGVWAAGDKEAELAGKPPALLVNPRALALTAAAVPDLPGDLLREAAASTSPGIAGDSILKVLADAIRSAPDHDDDGDDLEQGDDSTAGPAIYPSTLTKSKFFTTLKMRSKVFLRQLVAISRRASDDTATDGAAPQAEADAAVGAEADGGVEASDASLAPLAVTLAVTMALAREQASNPAVRTAVLGAARGALDSLAPGSLSGLSQKQLATLESLSGFAGGADAEGLALGLALAVRVGALPGLLATIAAAQTGEAATLPGQPLAAAVGALTEHHILHNLLPPSRQTLLRTVECPSLVDGRVCGAAYIDASRIAVARFPSGLALVDTTGNSASAGELPSNTGLVDGPFNIVGVPRAGAGPAHLLFAKRDASWEGELTELSVSTLQPSERKVKLALRCARESWPVATSPDCFPLFVGCGGAGSGTVLAVQFDLTRGSMVRSGSADAVRAEGQVYVEAFDVATALAAAGDEGAATVRVQPLWGMQLDSPVGPRAFVNASAISDGRQLVSLSSSLTAALNPAESAITHQVITRYDLSARGGRSAGALLCRGTAFGAPGSDLPSLSGVCLSADGHAVYGAGPKGTRVGVWANEGATASGGDEASPARALLTATASGLTPAPAAVGEVAEAVLAVIDELGREARPATDQEAEAIRARAAAASRGQPPAQRREAALLAAARASAATARPCLGRTPLALDPSPATFAAVAQLIAASASEGSLRPATLESALGVLLNNAIALTSSRNPTSIAADPALSEALTACREQLLAVLGRQGEEALAGARRTAQLVLSSALAAFYPSTTEQLRLVSRLLKRRSGGAADSAVLSALLQRLRDPTAAASMVKSAMAEGDGGVAALAEALLAVGAEEATSELSAALGGDEAAADRLLRAADAAATADGEAKDEEIRPDQATIDVAKPPPTLAVVDGVIKQLALAVAKNASEGLPPPTDVASVAEAVLASSLSQLDEVDKALAALEASKREGGTDPAEAKRKANILTGFLSRWCPGTLLPTILTGVALEPVTARLTSAAAQAKSGGAAAPGKAWLGPRGLRSLMAVVGSCAQVAARLDGAGGAQTRTSSIRIRDKKVLKRESAHEYANNTNDTEHIQVPGATRYEVKFTDRCNTEGGADWVGFCRVEPQQSLSSGNDEAWFRMRAGGNDWRISGQQMWPGAHNNPVMHIPASEFYLHFHTDGSITRWGWECEITAFIEKDVTVHMKPLISDLSDAAAFAAGVAVSTGLIGNPATVATGGDDNQPNEDGAVPASIRRWLAHPMMAAGLEAAAAGGSAEADGLAGGAEEALARGSAAVERVHALPGDADTAFLSDMVLARKGTAGHAANQAVRAKVRGATTSRVVERALTAVAAAAAKHSGLVGELRAVGEQALAAGDAAAVEVPQVLESIWDSLSEVRSRITLADPAFVQQMAGQRGAAAVAADQPAGGAEPAAAAAAGGGGDDDNASDAGSVHDAPALLRRASSVTESGEEAGVAALSDRVLDRAMFLLCVAPASAMKKGVTTSRWQLGAAKAALAPSPKAAAPPVPGAGGIASLVKAAKSHASHTAAKDTKGRAEARGQSALRRLPSGRTAKAAAPKETDWVLDFVSARGIGHSSYVKRAMMQHEGASLARAAALDAMGIALREVRQPRAQSWVLAGAAEALSQLGGHPLAPHLLAGVSRATAAQVSKSFGTLLEAAGNTVRRMVEDEADSLAAYAGQALSAATGADEASLRSAIRQAVAAEAAMSAPADAAAAAAEEAVAAAASAANPVDTLASSLSTLPNAFRSVLRLDELMAPPLLHVMVVIMPDGDRMSDANIREGARERAMDAAAIARVFRRYRAEGEDDLDLARLCVCWRHYLHAVAQLGGAIVHVADASNSAARADPELFTGDDNIGELRSELGDNFVRMNRVRRALRAPAATTVELARRLRDAIDRDSDGTISEEEFLRGFFAEAAVLLAELTTADTDDSPPAGDDNEALLAGTRDAVAAILADDPTAAAAAAEEGEASSAAALTPAEAAAIARAGVVRGVLRFAALPYKKTDWDWIRQARLVGALQDLLSGRSCSLAIERAAQRAGADAGNPAVLAAAAKALGAEAPGATLQASTAAEASQLLRCLVGAGAGDAEVGAVLQQVIRGTLAPAAGDRTALLTAGQAEAAAAQGAAGADAAPAVPGVVEVVPPRRLVVLRTADEPSPQGVESTAFAGQAGATAPAPLLGRSFTIGLRVFWAGSATGSLVRSLAPGSSAATESVAVDPSGLLMVKGLAGLEAADADAAPAGHYLGLRVTRDGMVCGFVHVTQGREATVTASRSLRANEWNSVALTVKSGSAMGLFVNGQEDRGAQPGGEAQVMAEGLASLPTDEMYAGPPSGDEEKAGRRGDPIVRESAHPYENNENQNHTVRVPKASRLIVTFDEQTRTEPCDYIQFFAGPTAGGTRAGPERVSGGRGGGSRTFPGLDGNPPLVIEGDVLTYTFRSDGSIVDWGFRMNIVPEFPAAARLDDGDQPLTRAMLGNPSPFRFGAVAEHVMKLPGAAALVSDAWVSPQAALSESVVRARFTEGAAAAEYGSHAASIPHFMAIPPEAVSSATDVLSAISLLRSGGAAAGSPLADVSVQRMLCAIALSGRPADIGSASVATGMGAPASLRCRLAAAAAVRDVLLAGSSSQASLGPALQAAAAAAGLGSSVQGANVFEALLSWSAGVMSREDALTHGSLAASSLSVAGAITAAVGAAARAGDSAAAAAIAAFATEGAQAVAGVLASATGAAAGASALSMDAIGKLAVGKALAAAAALGGALPDLRPGTEVRVIDAEINRGVLLSWRPRHSLAAVQPCHRGGAPVAGASPVTVPLKSIKPVQAPSAMASGKLSQADVAALGTALVGLVEAVGSPAAVRAVGSDLATPERTLLAELQARTATAGLAGAAAVAAAGDKALAGRLMRSLLPLAASERRAASEGAAVSGTPDRPPSTGSLAVRAGALLQLLAEGPTVPLERLPGLHGGEDEDESKTGEEGEQESKDGAGEEPAAVPAAGGSASGGGATLPALAAALLAQAEELVRSKSKRRTAVPSGDDAEPDELDEAVPVTAGDAESDEITTFRVLNNDDLPPAVASSSATPGTGVADFGADARVPGALAAARQAEWSRRAWTASRGTLRLLAARLALSGVVSLASAWQGDDLPLGIAEASGAGEVADATAQAYAVGLLAPKTEAGSKVLPAVTSATAEALGSDANLRQAVLALCCQRLGRSQVLSSAVSSLAKVVDATSASAKPVRVESEHPYQHNLDEPHPVTVRHAESLSVSFEEGTVTESGCDWVEIRTPSGEVVGERYSGQNWPGLGGRPPVVVPGDSLVIFFHTDSSVNAAGWTASVTPKLPPSASADGSAKRVNAARSIARALAASASLDPSEPLPDVGHACWLAEAALRSAALASSGSKFDANAAAMAMRLLPAVRPTLAPGAAPPSTLKTVLALIEYVCSSDVLLEAAAAADGEACRASLAGVFQALCEAMSPAKKDQDAGEEEEDEEDEELDADEVMRSRSKQALVVCASRVVSAMKAVGAKLQDSKRVDAVEATAASQPAAAAAGGAGDDEADAQAGPSLMQQLEALVQQAVGASGVAASASRWESKDADWSAHRVSREPAAWEMVANDGDAVWNKEEFSFDPASSRFPTVRPTRGSPAVRSGKWFFEVEFQTLLDKSAFQLGWGVASTFGANPLSPGNGVGDTDDSWGLCPFRARLFHGGRAHGGSGAGCGSSGLKQGDTLTCCVDCDDGSLYFGLNGNFEQPWGRFDLRVTTGTPLLPAITSQRGTGKVRIRLGNGYGRPLKYAPPVEGALPYGALLPRLLTDQDRQRLRTANLEAEDATYDEALLANTERATLLPAAGATPDQASFTVPPLASGFPTVAVSGAPATAGKWYWEVVMGTHGDDRVFGDEIAQIGVATPDELSNMGGEDGIGDKDASWALCMDRATLWHGDGEAQHAPFGRPVRDGEVLCVCFDADAGTLRFGVDGNFEKPMGEVPATTPGWSEVRADGGLVPALSTNRPLAFCLGHGYGRLHFAPPEGFAPWGARYPRGEVRPPVAAAMPAHKWLGDKPPASTEGITSTVAVPILVHDQKATASGTLDTIEILCKVGEIAGTEPFFLFTADANMSAKSAQIKAVTRFMVDRRKVGKPQRIRLKKPIAIRRGQVMGICNPGGALKNCVVQNTGTHMCLFNSDTRSVQRNQSISGMGRDPSARNYCFRVGMLPGVTPADVLAARAGAAGPVAAKEDELGVGPPRTPAEELVLGVSSAAMSLEAFRCGEPPLALIRGPLLSAMRDKASVTLQSQHPLPSLELDTAAMAEEAVAAAAATGCNVHTAAAVPAGAEQLPTLEGAEPGQMVVRAGPQPNTMVVQAPGASRLNFSAMAESYLPLGMCVEVEPAPSSPAIVTGVPAKRMKPRVISGLGKSGGANEGPAELGEPVIEESRHPYENSTDRRGQVTVPDAQRIRVTFLGNTRTEHGCDTLTLYSDEGYSNQVYRCQGRDGSSDWPGLNGRPPVDISGNTVYYHFRTDPSINDWGWMMRVVAIEPEAEDEEDEEDVDAVKGAIAVPGDRAIVRLTVHPKAEGTPEEVTAKARESLEEVQRQLAAGQEVAPEPMPGRAIEFESPHPYANSTHLKEKISIPGAVRLLISFSDETRTESGCDWVRFYRDSDAQEELSPAISGTDWPGSGTRPPLEIQGHECYYVFHTDASVNTWGYKMTVTPVIPAIFWGMGVTVSPIYPPAVLNGPAGKAAVAEYLARHRRWRGQHDELLVRWLDTRARELNKDAASVTWPELQVPEPDKAVTMSKFRDLARLPRQPAGTDTPVAAGEEAAAAAGGGGGGGAGAAAGEQAEEPAAAAAGAGAGAGDDEELEVAPAAAWGTVPERLALLQSLVGSIGQLLRYYDPARSSDPKSFTSLLMASQHLIMPSTIEQMWETALAQSGGGSGSGGRLVLSRSRAAIHAARGLPDLEGRKTIFGQAFQQLHSKPAASLRSGGRLYTVYFKGERSEDAGGPYRETFEEYTRELQSTALSLLLPCPNRVAGNDLNADQWVPNPSATSVPEREMYRFLGKLMGYAIRSKNYLALNLPRLFWKRLLGAEPNYNDLYAIDKDTAQNRIDWVRNGGNLDEETWDASMLAFYTAMTVDDREVELEEGGADRQVMWHDRADYARRVLQFKLHEFDEQIAEVRRGLSTVVPVGVLSLFSAEQVARMVCGSPEFDCDLLERMTQFNSCSRTDDHVQRFFRVLRTFETEDQFLFLRFVWGRSRMPTNEREWARSRRFTLQNFGHGSMPSADAPANRWPLPVSHTCFFSLELPRYPTDEIMADRLLYAFRHCTAIDGDEGAESGRMGWEEAEED